MNEQSYICRMTLRIMVLSKELINVKSKLHINTLFMLLAFGVNLGISFFVSPIIVNKIGNESYAFVKLASDFTNYATIITAAINSVSARYISIEYHRGNKKEAEEYFNSVLWSNLTFSAIFVFGGIILIINLDRLLAISPELIFDVKKLFMFMLINLVLSVVSTVFTVATFITNTLYLSSIANAIASIFKILIIMLLFGFFSPQIWIVGFANCAYVLIYGMANYKFRKKLLPEFRLSMELFSLQKTKKMVKSGIWSSISGISNTLSDGLDLLVSNLFIGTVVMGQLSISKTVSSMIASLISQLSNLFSPELTEYYAKNDSRKMLQEYQLAMKFTGMISSVFFCVFLVLGRDFFALWVPNQDIDTIYVFAVLCTMSVLVSGIISPLNTAFVITDHLKTNSLVWLAVSFLDIGIVFLLLRNTSLGGYAIAGVSSLVGTVINITYVPIIVCRYLNLKKKDIYCIIIRHLFISIIGTMGLYSVEYMWNIMEYNWFIFFLKGFVYASIIILINIVFLFDKREKRVLFGRLTERGKVR